MIMGEGAVESKPHHLDKEPTVEMETKLWGARPRPLPPRAWDPDKALPLWKISVGRIWLGSAFSG